MSDFDPLERKMQHSLNAAVMHLTHAGTRIHVIGAAGAAAAAALSVYARRHGLMQVSCT